MMKKTAAQKHTKAHFERRARKDADRHNWPLPHIRNYVSSAEIQIVSDKDGELYRINTTLGTIRRVRWED